MPIHAHTSFSALDGMGSPAQHVKVSKEKGLDGFAITDHALTSGMYRAEEACVKAGINFVAGVESYWSEDRFDKHKDSLFGFNPPHILFLAKNLDGLASINSLVYHSYYDGFYGKPRVDWDIIKDNSNGIICTSACVGSPVGKFIQKHDFSRARNWIAEAQDVFGDDFYLEVQPHDFDLQKTQNRFLSSIDPSRLIASVDSHYPTPDDAPAQFVSVCVGTKSTLENPALTYDNDHSIKSYEEVYESLMKTGGLTDDQSSTAIENSKRILNTHNVKLPRGVDLAPAWENAKEDLKQNLSKGLQEKIAPKVKTQIKMDEYTNRLRYEYDMICDKGFAEYFMVTKDMVDAAKKEGVFVGSGRGSASGSLISYLLGITEVDPIRWNLSFERFLSPDRGGYQMAFHDPNKITELIEFYDEQIERKIA